MKPLTQMPLGEIMATRTGTVDPSQYPDEMFDLYSIPAFDKGEPDVLLGQDIGSAKQVVQPGDVLLSKIVPHIRRSWVVGKSRGRRLIASGEWIVFRSESFHAPYLRHVLTSDRFHGQFMGTVAGVGGSLLRARPAQVAGLSIPLPSLPEQRRIADILDKADTVRRKRQEAIGQTYDLRRVLLLVFTGDAASAHVRSELHNTSTYLPKGFRWRRLDEVCDAICDIDHNMPKAVEKGVPFISPKDMPDNEELCFDEVKYISKEDFDRLSRKIKPRRNDIIYSRIGARLGKARLVRVDFDFLPSYSCCTIRVKENEVHPEYVTYYLDSIITRRQANLDTQSIAVPDLGLAKIKAFLVPVPSMEKQLQFVAQINVINSQISKMKSAVSDADNLFNSLVQRAFRGEL